MGLKLIRCYHVTVLTDTEQRILRFLIYLPISSGPSGTCSVGLRKRIGRNFKTASSSSSSSTRTSTVGGGVTGTLRRESSRCSGVNYWHRKTTSYPGRPACWLASVARPAPGDLASIPPETATTTRTQTDQQTEKPALE